jgi:hypothetical protein
VVQLPALALAPGADLGARTPAMSERRRMLQHELMVFRFSGMYPEEGAPQPQPQPSAPRLQPQPQPQLVGVSAAPPSGAVPPQFQPQPQLVILSPHGGPLPPDAARRPPFDQQQAPPPSGRLSPIAGQRPPQPPLMPFGMRPPRRGHGSAAHEHGSSRAEL